MKKIFLSLSIALLSICAFSQPYFPIYGSAKVYGDSISLGGKLKLYVKGDSVIISGDTKEFVLRDSTLLEIIEAHGVSDSKYITDSTIHVQLHPSNLFDVKLSPQSRDGYSLKWSDQVPDDSTTLVYENNVDKMSYFVQRYVGGSQVGYVYDYTSGNSKNAFKNIYLPDSTGRYVSHWMNPQSTYWQFSDGENWQYYFGKDNWNIHFPDKNLIAQDTAGLKINRGLQLGYSHKSSVGDSGTIRYVSGKIQVFDGGSWNDISGGGGVTSLWYDSSNVIKPLNNNYTIELTSTSSLKSKLFIDNYGVNALRVRNASESNNGAVFENVVYGGRGARFSNTISGGIGGYFSNTVSGGISAYFTNLSGTAIEINCNSSGKSIVNTYSGNTTFLLEPVGNVKATKYYVLSLNAAPSSATDTGTAGEIRVTATHIYVCTATNTWVRTALTTW